MTLTIRQETYSIGEQWPGPFHVDWDVVRLKFLASIYAGGTPDRRHPEYWEDGTIPWLNSGAVNQWIIREPSALITDAAYESSSAKWIPSESLVMALAGQGRTKGMVAQTAIRTTCNQSMAALVPSDDVVGKYLLWWLHIGYETVRNLAGGEARDGLNLEIIGGIPCPLPPLDRQRAIAAYLDRETVKIDAMIAAKERLLALLAEKRRALITHAVTRGLNPDAPMKDSGVEWLGEIPEHWTLTRLKFLAEIRGGVTLGKSYGIKPLIEVPYLRVANVQVGRVNLDEVKNISVPSEERDRYLLRAGDLLMTEGGDIDKLGRGCVWREQIAPCIHQNHVFAVRTHDVDPEWLARWTDAEPSRAYFEITAKRSTNLASISGSNIGELPVLVPPGAEMVQILSQIEHSMGQLDALSEHAGSTIQLLRERRSALIAAAVTGQVDVEDAA